MRTDQESQDVEIRWSLTTCLESLAAWWGRVWSRSADVSRLMEDSEDPPPLAVCSERVLTEFPHAWVPIKEGSSLDACQYGCGWRRFRMVTMVARQNMVAYVRGGVEKQKDKRIDLRRWLDEEPACAHVSGPQGMTTAEWCMKHAENRPSIHVVYDEFNQPES